MCLHKCKNQRCPRKSNYKKVYEFIQKQNNENSLSFIHFMHNIVMFFTKTDVSKCIDYANDLHNKLNNMGITATIGVSEKTVNLMEYRQHMVRQTKL